MIRARVAGALALAWAAAALAVTPARAEVRPEGAVDAVGLVAADAFGGAATVDLWAPAGPLRLGGVLGLGALTSGDDQRSRVLMPVGASVGLVFGGDRRPFFDLRLRAGAWAGATSQGLRVGGWLAGGAYFGYALGPNVSLGAGVSAWLLAGHGHIVAVAPGLTFAWVPFED